MKSPHTHTERAQAGLMTATSCLGCVPVNKHLAYCGRFHRGEAELRKVYLPELRSGYQAACATKINHVVKNLNSLCAG